MTKIKEIFEDDPTRELEEVEKVNSREHLERDVREFYETESAKKVLSELSEILDPSYRTDPRFLYIHATFGSGKTLLMKLIGLATGEIEEGKHFANELSKRYSGFEKFRSALAESEIDRLDPIFLNLLDRDTTQEPPIPLIVYEAFGRRKGYPTDPRWLLELVWRLDVKYGLWGDIQEKEYEGKTFEDVRDNKGMIRKWLYNVLPSCDGVERTPLENKKGIEEEIEDAEKTVDPREFSPKDLSERLSRFMEMKKEETGEKLEFLIGLDEIALFVGENQSRYREFMDMMEAFFDGPNIPVIGTGQWSLEKIHEEFEGEAEKGAWYTNEVGLEAAETEVIAQNRWLRKDEQHKKKLKDILDEQKFDLRVFDESIFSESELMETYPFKHYDLSLLRLVMKNLITKGQPIEREYIQGRALLILVRSLFTRFDWGEREVGELVSWDVLYDLLVEETPYVDTWVQDKIAKMEDNEKFRDEVADVGKALFMLNKLDEVPATTENITTLLQDEVDQDIKELKESVDHALEVLNKKHYIHEEEREGLTIHKLLSEEALDAAEEIDQELGNISTYRMRGKVRELIRNLDDKGFLFAEESRQEKNLKDERKIPLYYRYSILENKVDPNPRKVFDSLVVRVLVGSEEELEKGYDHWRDVNNKENWLEDVLISIKIPTMLKERLQRFMASKNVLKKKTSELGELKEQERELEREVEEGIEKELKNAKIYTASDDSSLGTYEEDFEGLILREIRSKFPDRKSLSIGLREIDDARKMAQFFDGDRNAWPLEDEDKEMLIGKGVETDITGGWAQELIQKYEDDPVVNGETLLNEIRGIDGDYKGSSLESLKAVILCLTTSRSMGMKKDGETIIDPADMGRAVGTQAKIENIDLKPGGGVDKHGVEKLENLCKNLVGFVESGRDPDSMQRMIADRVENNYPDMKKVNKKLKLEFGDEGGLDELIEALKPALEGDELNRDDLLSDEVLEQAERFKNGEELFLAEEPSTWEQYKEKKKIMEERYPSNDIFKRMRGIDELENPNDLRGLINEAERSRVNKLKTVYSHLAQEEKSFDEVDEAFSSLKDWLRENIDDFSDQLDDVKSEFGHKSSFESIESIVNKAKKEELVLEDVEGEEVVSETIEFRNACRLLVKGEDGPAWERLKEAYKKVREEHPESLTTQKLESAVESEGYPSMERVEKLVEEAEAPVSTGDGDERDEEDNVKKLMKELEEKIEDDDIVLVQSEED